MLKEFKKFLMQGDLVDIAIAFILAAAFKTVVDSLVADVITPIIAAIGGKPSFDDLTLKIGDGVIKYGSFINTIISFVIIGFVLFMVVKGYNKVKALQKESNEPEDVPEDIALLREIRDSLRRAN